MTPCRHPARDHRRRAHRPRRRRARARPAGCRPSCSRRATSAGAAVREWGHVRLFSPWSRADRPRCREPARRRRLGRPRRRQLPDRRRVGRPATSQPLADALSTPPTWSRSASAAASSAWPAGPGPPRGLRSGVGAVHRPRRDRLGPGRSPRRPSSTRQAPGADPTRSAADGLPALGEAEHADRICYGIPDLGDPQGGHRYAGKHVVGRRYVAPPPRTPSSGSPSSPSGARHPGHLAAAPAQRRTTRSAVATTTSSRRAGRSASRAERAVGSGRRRRSSPRSAPPRSRAATTDRLTVVASAASTVTDVDEIVVVTGFRPDLDVAVRGPARPRPGAVSRRRTLAPLIDPNVHSCGTVYPHGATELVQPEPGFYLVGMKSYGRAPSFLALTGCEQARSVVAADRRRPRGRRAGRARPPRARASVEGPGRSTTPAKAAAAAHRTNRSSCPSAGSTPAELLWPR